MQFVRAAPRPPARSAKAQPHAHRRATDGQAYNCAYQNIHPAASATAQPTRTLAPVGTRTPSPSSTARPTATQAPTVSAPPREIKVRIEADSGNTVDYWLVNSQRILLSSSTHVNQTNAAAQVGGWAIVSALQMPDGSVVAQEIIVSHSPAETPLLQEFSGVIERIEAERWTVAGRQILLLTGTVIEGTPQVGAVAHVQARQFTDGRLVADHIRVASPSEQVVQFAGPIQEMGAGRWVIAEQTVLIGPDTQIEGSPAIGAIAEVKASVLSDGTKLAMHIRVQPPTAIPATAQPTATSRPTSAPTAEPTAMPTAGTVPTEAPTATPSPDQSPSSTPIVETTPFAPTPEI